METSRQYTAREVERMMKVQEVLLKAMAKKTSWADSAEIEFPGQEFRVLYRVRVTRRLAKWPPEPSPTQRPRDPRVRSLNSLTTRQGALAPFAKTVTLGRSTTMRA